MVAMARVLAVFGLLWAMSSTVALAGDEPPTVHEARRLFEEGERLYNVARYDEALKSYQSAYVLSPKPIVLFNVGQCYRKLKKHDEAIHAYKRYVASGDAAVARADVESLIEGEERAAEAERKAAEKPAEAPRPAAAQPAVPVSPVAAVPERGSPDTKNSSSKRWLWATLGGVGGAVVLGGVGIGIAYAIPNDASMAGQIELPFAGSK